MNPPGAANRREGDRLPFASRGSARRIALPRLLFVGPRPSFTPCMDQRPFRGASADPRANRRGTRWRFGGPRSPSARHPWGGRDQVGPGEGLEPAFQNRGCARGLDVLLCDPGGSVAIGYDRLNSLRATPAGFEPAFMRRRALTHTVAVALTWSSEAAREPWGMHRTSQPGHRQQPGHRRGYDSHLPGRRPALGDG